MSHIISHTAITQALSGENPPLGHSLTAAELGKRLAPHRRGRYAGVPFTRAAISLYKQHPGEQSPDFVEAWRSWIAAETTRQDQLRVRYNDLTVDELLGETGYLQQLGPDPVRAIIAVGQLPPGTLISVNGTATAIECTADISTCECGQKFVRRSWNHRRCARCRQAMRQGGVK
jgi:hypothetical protein